MTDIRNTTQFPTPKQYKWSELTTHALGKNYELSVVFCGEKLMRRINHENRGKDYATNVLSFPLSEGSGELFICLPQCKKQHKEFERSYNNFIAFLFVHGLVHLKGYDHGDTMNTIEARIRKRFNI